MAAHLRPQRQGPGARHLRGSWDAGLSSSSLSFLSPPNKDLVIRCCLRCCSLVVIVVVDVVATHSVLYKTDF